MNDGQCNVENWEGPGPKNKHQSSRPQLRTVEDIIITITTVCCAIVQEGSATLKNYRIQMFTLSIDSSLLKELMTHDII